ncbi:MAG: GNAT family N-acetyltransferase [Cyanomargarita calcarea GSE-NOS-MK-12-04C]|jgi:GNAT superfamily N-acetyltransferase|uniref:GNAT family N-acetyltransferase n=1 Tax=Cyanomargarita calcarea GSE-NOS-MK-12-04C TaxID=2839659 RepID=A0A951UWF2_9CYAN|nr:GNAT family N-acetyltransferase [Cyanomargarita calcarea GSE-NOS-MK-12-04C]
MKEELELNQIFVDPMYQKRGVSLALLNKAKEICPQGLSLHTLQQNRIACVFYEKQGFQARKLSINEINGQPNTEYYWIP